VIYIPSKNIAFVHAPKIAGTWIRRVLVSLIPDARGDGKEHGDRSDAVELYGAEVKTFCFVRHPLSWYRSFWAHRELIGWGGDWAIGRDCQSRDFNTFAIACAARHPGFLSEIYRRFTDGAVFVGRFERVDEDMIDILRSLLEVEMSVPEIRAQFRSIPQENRAASLPALRARSEYSDEARDAILESEWHALQAWYP